MALETDGGNQQARCKGPDDRGVVGVRNATVEMEASN